MVKRLTYFFFGLLWLSCQRNTTTEQSVIESDAKIIGDILTHIDSKAKIDTLINLGLYNLAFESFNNNIHGYIDAEKASIAKCFIDNGEFDKGLSIVDLLETNKSQYEILHLKLLCALNKQDNTVAQFYLDSLNMIYSRANDSLKSTELTLLKAYHAHNSKNYLFAIKLNKDAIKMIISLHLPEEYLALAYHRLGNSYNDIVRDNITFNEKKAICYKKAMLFYTKELSILRSNIHQNNTRIALNYITTAMVERAFHPEKNHSKYYEKALKELIVANDSFILITRNPIYTSIALTQFGSLYYKYDQKYAMDSVSELNKKLIDTRSYYKINDRQSLDILEYFPQRSQEVRILYHFKKGSENYNPLELLNLSNNSKYSNQYLTSYLHKVFGAKANQAVNNWILLNELKILTIHKKDSLLQHQINNRLPFYNQAILKLNKNKVKSITVADIFKLKTYCKNSSSSIIDYQMLYGGSMLLTVVDQNGIRTKWVQNNVAINKPMVESLISFMSIAPEQYNKLAADVAKRLGISEIKTKNIIVCPDEYLEGVSFESLTKTPSSSKSWIANDYIGNNQNIRYIPNLNSLLDPLENSGSINVNVWTSDIDNSTLPYNKQLTDFLKEKYGAKINHSEPSNILHVLAHTYQTEQNNIEFRLNKDTLTVYSNDGIKPSLAILEGCGSGKGNNHKFEGSISQNRCFLYNGTPTVVYSLWDADNHSSTYLFQQFYTYLHQGMSASESLFRAKSDTRNNVFHPEWANPFYWANFQLSGKDQSFAH